MVNKIIFTLFLEVKSIENTFINTDRVEYFKYHNEIWLKFQDGGCTLI